MYLSAQSAGVAAALQSKIVNDGPRTPQGKFLP